MTIEFDTGGNYPNGYSLTNDELFCIHQLMAEDPSRNYVVREVGATAKDYHLEVTATYRDNSVPDGPRWSIKDGVTTRLPDPSPWTETLDGLDPTELRSLGQAAFEKAFWLEHEATDKKEDS